jgi:hypothetical protein
MQEKIGVTYEQFVNTPFDEIEKREILQRIVSEFRYINQDKSNDELSIEWDKVRRDDAKWNELLKKALE